MLKKKFIIFILIFCMVCPIIVGCASNNDNGNNNQDNNITNSINISYMKDLSIDLGSSTAFGIKKGSVTNASPRSARRSKSLLNASLMSNEPEITEKNYLYTTTELLVIIFIIIIILYQSFHF